MCTVSYHDLIQHVGVSEDNLDKKCTRDHLAKISKELENWLDYVHYLGLSDQETNSIRTDSMLSYTAQSRRALEIWYNKNGFTAKYSRLAQVFLDAGNANIAEAVCRIAGTDSPLTSVASAGPLVSANSETNLTSSPSGSQTSSHSSAPQAGSSPSVTTSDPTATQLLDKDTRENLEGRLQDEAQQMDFHFCRVVSKVRKSLENRKLDPKLIGQQLSLMKAVTKQVVDPDEDIPFLFHHNRKALARVESIFDLYDIITPYFSFFNYDIIEEIVVEFGDMEDKRIFHDYLEKFNQFCKRRATEVPPLQILDGDGPCTTKFKVKIEEDFQQMYTVKAVRAFRAKLCKILEVTEPCLRLLSIEEGCILLTFSLPIFILHHIFPLTSKQEESLIEQGCIEYVIGGESVIKLRQPSGEETVSKVDLSKVAALCDDQSEPVKSEETTPKSAPPAISRPKPLPLLARSPDINVRNPSGQPATSLPTGRSSTSPVPFPHQSHPTPDPRKVSLPNQWTYPSAPHRGHSRTSSAHLLSSQQFTPISPPHEYQSRSRSPIEQQSNQPLPSPRPSHQPLSASGGSPQVYAHRPHPHHGTITPPGRPHFEAFPIHTEMQPPGPTPYSVSADKPQPRTLPLSAFQPQNSEGTLIMGQRRDSYKQQMATLADMYRQTKHTLGLFYTHKEYKELGGEIRKAMSRVFTQTDNTIREFEMRRDDPYGWLANATSEGVSKFIFVGHPPSTKFPESSCDVAKFFNSPTKRLSDIIFIVNIPSIPPTLERQFSCSWQKQLKRYLHLDGSLSVSHLVKSIMAHFIAPAPVLHGSSDVYWSNVPRLIRVRMKKPELGLMLVTREMSASAFPSIIVVKAVNNDCCMDELRHIGKHTHIQSINGHFLDGLSLQEATSVFHSESEKKIVQLIVRHVHKAGSATGGKSVQSGLKEDLPIPVFILSDNYKRTMQLFSFLTASVLSPILRSPQSTTHSTTSSPSTPPHSNISKQQDTSIRVKSAPNTPPQDTKSSPSAVQADICKVSPPTMSSISPPLKRIELEGRLGETTSSSDSSPQHASSEKKESENWIMRTHSHTTFKFNPSISGTPSLEETRQLASLQQLHIGHKQYVYTAFKEGLDRRLAHLFLRSSGVYLATIWLEDLMADVLIQFDNISYWLRLLQNHFNDKRALIVGMFDGKSGKRGDHFQEFIRRLNLALSESSLHKNLLDLNWKKKQKRPPQFVAVFDINQPQKSTDSLLAKINDCTNLLITETFFKDKQSFRTIFEAFEGLNTSLLELSLLDGVTASSKRLQALCSHKPPYTASTLATYSTALVDVTTGDVLLKPGFLIDLILSLGAHLNAHPESETTLPTASRSVIIEVMKTMEPQLDMEKVHIILKWAEQLDLFYPIGSLSKGGPTYFVPLLATSCLGDKALFCWSAKEEKLHSREGVTLFASLNFPATSQFFHKFLALLLKERYSERVFIQSKLWIDYDCNKTVGPLSTAESSNVLSVLIAYHSLQNVIEFRALKMSTSTEQILYETVLKALKSVFQDSPFSKNAEFTGAVSFHTPSPTYSDKLLSSSLWKLWECEYAEGEMVDPHHKEPADLLLKTKEYSPLHLQTCSPRKEIPAELFLKWGKMLSSSPDSWALVGAKLKLLSTEDVQFLTYNPSRGGNGAEVLSRWENSLLPYYTLVATLRSPDISLVALADEIERFYIKS